MNELPDKVMLWHNCLPLTHIGQWANTRYPEDAEEYVKVSALPGMVKPLEWKAHNEIGHGRTHYGFGVFGHWYAVSRSGQGKWHCSTHISGKTNQIGYFPSKEAAKAAAQAHYVAQVIQAFGLVPSEQ